MEDFHTNEKHVRTVNNEEPKCSPLHDEYVKTDLVLTLRAPNIWVTGLVFGIQLLFWNACWELPKIHIEHLSEHDAWFH